MIIEESPTRATNPPAAPEMTDEAKQELLIKLGLTDQWFVRKEGDGLTPEQPIEPVSGATLERVIEEADRIAQTTANGMSYFEFSGEIYSYNKETKQTKKMRLATLALTLKRMLKQA